MPTAGRLSVAEAFAASVDFTASASKQLNYGLTLGTTSIFNKFSMFRYSKYGPGHTQYDSKSMFDGNDDSYSPSPSQTAQSQVTVNTSNSTGARASGQALMDQALAAQTGYSSVPSIIPQSISNSDSTSQAFQNPTAAAIIQWASSNTGNAIFGPTPYAWTDFLYCKWNGKIPNNRLVTLRRFPFPIRDSMKTPSGGVAVPIAQAVTWFGEQTGNKISDIMPGISWSLPWKMIDAQDGNGDVVQGNNLTLNDILSAVTSLPADFGGPNLNNLKTLLQGVIGASANVAGNSSQLDGLSGRYDLLKSYTQTQLYSSGGPYWNQVLGGVNYITSTMIRDRLGMAKDWQKPIEVKFEYSLKSYSHIKPKIAMLDIISNFLSLTYLNADFKGSFARLFRNAGITGDPTIDDAISQAVQQYHFGDALQLIISALGTEVLGATGLSSVMKNLPDLLSPGSIQNAIRSNGSDQANLLGKAFNGAFAAIAAKNLMRGPIVMRTPLTDEPVGEWHLVIGNPIEPIMTIGDLICTGCKMQFSEELGPDDFPMDVSFVVTLQMGRPRDKLRIDQMFNLGEGFLTENPIAPPPSNTFAQQGGVASAANSNVAGSQLNAYQQSLTQAQQNNLAIVSDRLNQSYGTIYGSSSLLPIYFMDNTRNVQSSFQTQVASQAPGTK